MAPGAFLNRTVIGFISATMSSRACRGFAISALVERVRFMWLAS
jgi:hypothetical protein